MYRLAKLDPNILLKSLARREIQFLAEQILVAFHEELIPEEI